MVDQKTLWSNILADVLMLGTLAAKIFVKNPEHQQTAGALISASSQALQVIEAQINPTDSNAAGK